MRERPILFSAPMVRAILDGRKTQTRRVVKPQPWQPLEYDDESGLWDLYAGDELCGSRACPYGQPGDQLWVRETWAHYQTVNHTRRSDGRSFNEVSDGLAGYRADGHDTIEDFRQHVRMMSGCDLEAVEINGNRWRPSIHMPRWASRITLEVTGVRVERLNAINGIDAKKEGVSIPAHLPHDGADLQHALREFRSLWDTINGPGSWEADPWVWVVEFKRITP